MVNYEQSPDFYNLDEKERIESLNTNCENILPDYTYSRPLTEGEIKLKNDQINQALQEIERLKDERSELNQAIKAQTEIIMENNHAVISKSVQVKEKVWEVVNTVTGCMEYINAEGYIIESIRLKSPRMVNMFNAVKKEAM